QRLAKRRRIVEIALGRGYARLAGDPVAGIAGAQHHRELDASGKQRLREQRADHSGGAADEQTGRNRGTSQRKTRFSESCDLSAASAPQSGRRLARVGKRFLLL